MTSYIVVFGLIVVVVLVVVLVALGLRASRAGRDDDDWMDDEPQPRGRRGAPQHEDMGGPEGYGYNDGYDTGYDSGYDRQGAPEPAHDRRVAGGPLAAPTAQAAQGPPGPQVPQGPQAPPPPAPSGQASDEMADDDYWATITFDKPKFPWQHDHDGERGDVDPAADPLNAQAPVEQAPADQPLPHQPNLTQPVSMGADGPTFGGMGAPGGQGGGTGPQQMAAPGGFQGGSPFANQDPGSTALDPIPADLTGPGGPGPQGGPQPPYGSGPGVPEQPMYGGQETYGGQEPQPAFGAADFGQSDQYGGAPDPVYGDPSPHGTHEPSYGSDPLGGRPAAAAGPPPAGRQDGYDFGLGSSGSGGGQPGGDPRVSDPRVSDPRVSDPLGLPLGRTDEPSAPPAPAAPAPPPPAAAAQGGAPGTDTDGHKLPTVDELLQRIQNDRQRSSGSPSDTGGGSYGGSLNDPLGDPLGTGSFGTGSGTGTTGPWSTSGQTGGYDSGAPSGYESGLGGTSGYGQGQQSDGYPTAPAYGDSSRYDDPLNGTGREPYATFDGGSGTGTDGQGVYGDFSGSSYNGGADPLSPPSDQGASGGGYGDPGATQSYGPGGYGVPQPGGYQQGHPNDTGPYGSRQPADDWENYRR
ncbi:hypothetical protein D0T12_30905 [Actinomadura spongiicola]|uniref:Large adhesin n=1 Tax=Actinomadura spongiicola TaxID=2303421 RepID=A0A372G8I0_9ACTN|nr:hypothetical protein [Actinomadura spongiicola]RFS81695.1 hypothetical protein D0T12_30905 [Actinomadura spongiicola]